jgi:hypothetical protein
VQGDEEKTAYAVEILEVETSSVRAAFAIEHRGTASFRTGETGENG